MRGSPDGTLRFPFANRNANFSARPCAAPDAEDLAPGVNVSNGRGRSARGHWPSPFTFDLYVAEVDDAEGGERVHARLQARTRRAARGPACSEGEACSLPVGDEIVRWRAHDRHIDVVQLRGILRVTSASEGQQAGVVGLLPVLAPAIERSIRLRVS